jgi:hypothetical protein
VVSKSDPSRCEWVACLPGNRAPQRLAYILQHMLAGPRNTGALNQARFTVQSFMSVLAWRAPLASLVPHSHSVPTLVSKRCTCWGTRLLTGTTWLTGA